MTPRQQRLLLALLAIGYLWLFPWADRLHNPNEMVRVYSVRAIAEFGTYAIGRRDLRNGVAVDSGPLVDQWGYVNDKALACDDPKAERPSCAGWLYAAKAPGLNQLGSVPHGLLDRGWRLATGHGPPKAAIVWWLRLWLAALPSIVGFWWLAGHLARTMRRPALGAVVVLAAAFGSLSLTYGQMFAGHQPAGMALLLAYGAVAGVTPEYAARRRLLCAGLGVGLATIIEFTAAPAGALLLAWLWLKRRRLADLPWVALGGLGPALLLAHFNWKAFGAPWRLPYGYVENPGFVQDMAPGFFGIHLPNAEKTVGSLFSPFTGLYFWAPWMALAWMGLLGARKLARHGESDPWHDTRGTAKVVWAICLYFLFFQCTHSLWRGGWVVGPRYITAMVPFAALAVAYGGDALQRAWAQIYDAVVGASAATAIAVTGAATAVCQGFPMEVFNPLPEVVTPLLRLGWVWSSPLYWAGLPARAAAVPWFLALAVAIGWALWAAARGSMRQPTPARARAALALAIASVAAAGVVVLWSVPSRRPAADQRETVVFLTETWWPLPLRGATAP
ncbi:MAG: hypothetical protein FJ100_17345 [Deltaproteobacteria bacterium]|nr:hypothetical protein [Deltaproteobacteria bacterium]